MKQHEFFVTFGSESNKITIEIYAFTYYEAAVLATSKQMQDGNITNIYCIEDDEGGRVENVKLEIDYVIVRK